MPKRKKKWAFPDREIIAKAEGRFAKADMQRASVKADPKKAVERARERVQCINKSAKVPKEARNGRRGIDRAMEYRGIEYSVSDTGNAQWRWKIHRELALDAATAALFGHADTKEDAIAKATVAIDQILDASSKLAP